MLFFSRTIHQAVAFPLQLGLILAAVPVIGCGDGGGGRAPGSPDAGPPEDPDAGWDGVATLAPEVPPAEVPVDEWLLSIVFPGTEDTVLAEAVDGTLELDGPGGIWGTLPAGSPASGGSSPTWPPPSSSRPGNGSWRASTGSGTSS